MAKPPPVERGRPPSRASKKKSTERAGDRALRCAEFDSALGRRRVDDRDEAPFATGAERDDSVALREDRVVLADARSGAGTELRAALADEDHPGRHVLAGEQLDAEHLR